MPITTRQVAKLAAISEQSVRNYSRDFADLLSPAARGENGPRLFDDTDAQTICTIATLRREDVSRADIIARLHRGDIVVEATPTPQQAPPTAQDGPHAAQMALAVLSSVQARLDVLERRVEGGASQLVTGIVIGAGLAIVVVAIVLGLG